MESGRRRRSSSRSSSSSGESSGSRNGSSSGSRRRRSSSGSGRASFREEAGTGRKALYLVLTLGGILALCVVFYVKLDPEGATQNQPPEPVATPTPRPTPFDDSAPPEPPRYLGLTMEQYLDKLDSWGDHLQEQADFAKSVVHEHVDWRCKVYSIDMDSLVKSVLLVSAAPGGDKYRVSAYFNKPNAPLINRIRLLQRGDTVRLTGAINEDNIRVIDADNLVLSN